MKTLDTEAQVTSLVANIPCVLSYRDARTVMCPELGGDRATEVPHLVFPQDAVLCSSSLANFNLYLFPVIICNQKTVFN